MSPSLLRMAGDERLARMVTAGHDHAFATLYDRYRDVLVRYCRSLVRDDQDALDAFQTTMLNALRALREDRRSAPVRPWLFRIAHNESVSVLRRRPASEPLDDRQVGSVDVQRTAEDREALAGLLEDLGALTDHQRSALLLRELGGLGYDDVADALETTPLAARQAVFAARASLHDQREGRELPCAMVQRRLSDADRRAARTRAVRAHLRRCDDCRGFASAIGRRRRAAVLVPIPPAFASSGLLATILDGAGGTAASAGGGAVAAGVVAKAAVALSAAVVATGAAERPRSGDGERVASASAGAAARPATAAARPAVTRTSTPAVTRRVATSSARAVAPSGTVHLTAIATTRTSTPQPTTGTATTPHPTAREPVRLTGPTDDHDLPHREAPAWRTPHQRTDDDTAPRTLAARPCRPAPPTTPAPQSPPAPTTTDAAPQQTTAAATTPTTAADAATTTTPAPEPTTPEPTTPTAPTT